jgi:hypothetical protein
MKKVEYCCDICRDTLAWSEGPDRKPFVSFDFVTDPTMFREKSRYVCERHICLSCLRALHGLYEEQNAPSP